MWIQYNAGNPMSPGNPFGRVELAIEADGAARLEQILPGGQRRRAWTATIDPGVVARLRDALAAAGYPKVPHHMPAAGSTIRDLFVTVDGARQGARIGWFEVAQMVGYKDAFEILDSLVRMISQEGWRAAPVKLPPEAIADLASLET